MTLFLRLLRYVRPYSFRFAAAILCSAFVSALTAAYAWLVRPAVNEVFISKNETWLYLIPVLLLIVTVSKGFASYGQSYFMSYVGARVVTDVRRELFQHLMRLPLGFHLRHPSSHMLSRVINDVNLIQNSVGGVLKDLFQQGLTFIALLSYVFYLNWQMTLLAIVILPLTVYPVIRFGKRMRRYATHAQERTADMSLALQETLTGIRIVKGFTQEAEEGRRFERDNEGFFRTVMKSAQVYSLTSPVLEVVGVIGIGGIMWYGGSQVINGDMDTGAFFSFLMAAMLMYNPIRRLAAANNNIQQALSAATRVFTILDEPTEQARDTGTKDLQGVQRSIEFRDVSFQYADTEDHALRHVTLTVGAGEVLALVGSSGAGKTTLVNLIPRFFEPAYGAILIDGVDTREIRLAALRKNIGIVSQDVHLFDASVRDNIAYGKPDSSLEAVEGAAKAAFAHEFIMALPSGYETEIGENGVRLSGGQRQRIAIARAILRDPPILILDEATSALDSESERMVQLALANLMRHRTTFVIAHRLSTVQHADKIAVLSKGHLVELGSHGELLELGGAYKKLHAMQFLPVEEVSL